MSRTRVDVRPPSTNRMWPVTKLASSLQRNAAAPATSAGWPARMSGMEPMLLLR